MTSMGTYWNDIIFGLKSIKFSNAYVFITQMSMVLQSSHGQITYNKRNYDLVLKSLLDQVTTKTYSVENKWNFYYQP